MNFSYWRTDEDGGNIEVLVKEYKSLIDFEDKDQKNNFKWVEHFLKRQKKHHPHEDNTSFLRDLIDIHRRVWLPRQQMKIDAFCEHQQREDD